MDFSLATATVAVDEQQKYANLEPSTKPNVNPSEIPMQSQLLASTVDTAVNKVLSRVEKLFSDHKTELDAKEAAAEKSRKCRMKKEKKEREEERKELVDMIREMALELEDRNLEIEEPVVLKDAVGRKFIFPYDSCKTWTGFEDLVKQAFLHIEVIGPQVNDGYYDILSPKGMVILPSVWDDVIEPGWEISMHMWPLADNWRQDNFLREPETKISNECGPPSPPPPPPPPANREQRLYDVLEEGRYPPKPSRSTASPEPLENSVAGYESITALRARANAEMPVDVEYPEDWDVMEPF